MAASQEASGKMAVLGPRRPVEGVVVQVIPPSQQEHYFGAERRHRLKGILEGRYVLNVVSAEFAAMSMWRKICTSLTPSQQRVHWRPPVITDKPFEVGQRVQMHAHTIFGEPFSARDVWLINAEAVVDGAIPAKRIRTVHA